LCVLRLASPDMSTPASFSRVAELKGENPPVVVYIEGVPLDSGSYVV
jgi:hypothetical protein